MPIPLFGKLVSGTGLPYADAQFVELDVSSFANNLDANVTNVQLLAQAVDALASGGGSGQDLLLSVVTHTATTGTQNYGGEFADRLHIIGGAVSGFDALSGSTFGDGKVFVVINGSSSSIEFDVSAVAQTFPSYLTSDAQAFSMLSGRGYMFWVKSNVIYLIGDIDLNPTAAGTSDHPVTLTRDTPTLANLGIIASASVNSNSGLWVVANDQVAATESGVDSTIMIRAVKSGLLDADNQEIPLTQVQKSTIRLAAGTIVRVFSATDLRVVFSPGQRQQAQMYPDQLTGAAPLDLRSPTTYAAYRNRTAVLDDTGTTSMTTWQVYLPTLQLSPGYVNRDDVFGFRNDRTDSLILRVRTFQVGTTFSNGAQEIDLAPGQVLYITPAPTGHVWTILQRGQASELNTEVININTDWYRDGTDSTAADNGVRLHHRQDIVDGDLRNHVLSATADNNPLTFRLYKRDIEDDIAWINFWSFHNANVPPLQTSSIDALRDSVASALTYITNNISNGFDFILDDPAASNSVAYVTYISGDTVKIGVTQPLESHIVVGDVLSISSSSVTANNGDWAITTIYSDRLAFNITIPGASGANNTGQSGAIARTLYADAVLVSHDLRQVNIDLYHDSARTSPLTSLLPQWVDITMPGSGYSFLAIGYNNSLSIKQSDQYLQGRDGEFYKVHSGSRQDTHLLYNGDPNNGGATEPEFSTYRTIPTIYAQVHIQTQAAAEFVIPLHSENIPVGESRRIRVYSDPDNDANDVTLRVGHSSNLGWFEYFDGDIPLFSLQSGSYVDLEGYNDGSLHGWRIASAFQKAINSTTIYPTATQAFAGQIPIDVINQVLLVQSEDPSYVFLNSISNKFAFNTSLEYKIEAQIDLLFNGTEGTGLLFVPVELMPVLTRSSTDTDLPQYADRASLLFSRNGLTGNSAPKFQRTLKVDFTWQARQADRMALELRFGTFPQGDVTQLQIQNFRYTVTVQGRLD